MLDMTGTSRGSDTNDVAALQTAFQSAKVESFTKSSEVEAWEKNWPTNTKGTVAKIIYDRSAGEVRVVGRRKGLTFEKTFEVGSGLKSRLESAARFINEQAER